MVLHIPIFLRCHAVLLLKNSMEVTDVIVADCHGDIGDIHGSGAEQVGGLGETLGLDELGIGFSGAVFDLTGEPVDVVVKLVCKFGQLSSLVVLLHVA